jgi:hypothetical protein
MCTSDCNNGRRCRVGAKLMRVLFGSSASDLRARAFFFGGSRIGFCLFEFALLGPLRARAFGMRPDIVLRGADMCSGSLSSDCSSKSGLDDTEGDRALRFVERRVGGGDSSISCSLLAFCFALPGTDRGPGRALPVLALIVREPISIKDSGGLGEARKGEVTRAELVPESKEPFTMPSMRL